MSDEDVELPPTALSDKAVVILSMIAEGHSFDVILQAYGGITRADIAAAAAEALKLAEEKPATDGEAVTAYAVAAIRQEHPTAYAPWTEDEEQRLRQMVHEGASVAQIALALGRQTGGISSRIRRLGLREARQNAAKGVGDGE